MRRSPSAFWSFPMSCASSFSIGCLPIAGGAAAAGIAAAEAAKAAIAGIGAAESAGTATAPGAARHHVTEDQGGQEAAATAAAVAAGSAGAEEKDQQADAAENRGPGNGIGGRIANAAPKLGGEGDVLRLGDGRADGFRGRHEGFAVALLLQGGAHLAEHGAVEAVRKDGFEAIADFEAIAAVGDDQQEQEALVLTLLADGPGAIDGVGDVLDGLAGECGDGDKGHLGAGGALHGGAVGFELGLAGGVDDAGEIADVALRLKGFPIDGRAGRGEQAKQDAHPQPVLHVELPVYYAGVVDSRRRVW